MSRFKKKPGQKDLFPPKTRLLLKERLGLKGDGPYIFLEGIDSYEKEYARLTAETKQRHATLLGIFECDDRTFYDLQPHEQLQRFRLDEFKRLLFTVTDELDFMADPTTSENGIANDNHVRQTGTCVTGCTSVVERDGKRHTVILMRRETGGTSDPDSSVSPQDVKCATKIGALAHERGHVDDIEKGVNYTSTTMSLVGAEVYAHQYACRTLLDRNCFLALEFYLDGVDLMTNGSSEFVKIAATRIAESADYKQYRAIIMEHKEKLANLKQ